MSHPSVAILAGGLGIRLRSVVDDRPKVLAPVEGRPFLARLLDQVEAAAFPEAVLCTGHLGDQIETEFGTRYRGLRLVQSREPSPLGTAGALRHALPWLAGDPILVMNGDSYCDVDLRQLLAFHGTHDGAGSVVLTEVAEVSRFGSVSTDDVGRIDAFREKAAVSGAGWINAGIYVVSRRLLEMVPPDRPVSLERDMVTEWIKLGLYGYRVRGRFLDIGTPESYASAGAVLG